MEISQEGMLRNKRAWLQNLSTEDTYSVCYKIKSALDPSQGLRKKSKTILVWDVSTELRFYSMSHH